MYRISLPARNNERVEAPTMKEYRAEEERVKLEIRFDALNRSKELYVYNY